MKNSSTCMNEDQTQLSKILSLKLPHSYRRIGFLGALLTLAFLIGFKFLGSNSLLVKDILRSLILAFLLIATLSQEQLEDEYSQYIRFQSFVIAFVGAVVYAISIPLITVILEFFITKITGHGSVGFYKISAFEVLFSLLGFQLLSFEVLKRFGRA